MSERKLQIIVFGDSSVGKTCVLKRYVNDQFSETSQATVVLDAVTKKVLIDSQEIDVKIWDTAGQERFKSLAKSFFQNADGGIIVFDITSLESFQDLRDWIKQFEEHNLKSTTFIIVGNKSDMADNRKVSKEDAESFAQSQNTEYFEVSAKTGDNVNDAFEYLLKKALENYKDTLNLPQTKKLDEERPQNDSNCKC